MKLSVKALALAGAILWGSALFIVGIVNMACPPYGGEFLEIMGSVYPGYQPGTTGITGIIIGTLYGIADGGICGAVLAWLYNVFVE